MVNVLKRAYKIFYNYTFNKEKLVQIQDYIEKVVKENKDDKIKTNALNVINDNYYLKKFNYKNFVNALHCDGYTSKKNQEINIMVNNLQFSDNYRLLTRIIYYHERRHIFQYNKLNCYDSHNLNNILFQIDNTFVNSNSELQYILYLINHDNLYIELDANLNAIENVEKDISMNKEVFSDKELRTIYIKKIYHEYLLMNYDFDKFFSFFNFSIKYSNQEYLDNSIWYKTLYNPLNKLKNIDAIINSQHFNEINSEFINMVFTSRYFNKNISYDNISEKAKLLLLREFNIKIEKEREKLIKLNKLIKYVDSVSLTSSNINVYNVLYIINENINNIDNYFFSEFNIKNYKSILKYLSKDIKKTIENIKFYEESTSMISNSLYINDEQLKKIK